MKRIISKIKSQKGFTLVEVLIVIIVLGVLVAILAPRMFNNIDKARERADDITADRLEQAAYAYRDLIGVFPVTTSGGTTWLEKLEDEGLISDDTQFVPESGGTFTITVNAAGTEASVDF